MSNQRSQTVGFFVLLALVSIVAIMIFWPFWQLLVLAGVLAMLFQPLYQWVLKIFKSPSWSALLATLLVLIVVVIPVLLLGYALFLEANNLFRNLRAGGFSFDEAAMLSRLPESLQGVAQNFLQNFYQWLSGLAGSAVQNITSLISNVVNFFFACFLVFFSLFFLLRDGSALKNFFRRILPLSAAHESAVIDKLEQALSGVIKGSFLIALIQGAVATTGFLIFGVPQPFLWGAFTVLVAFVPTIGTALSVVPAIVYLFLTGHTAAGLGLIVWYALFHLTVDNLLGPRLIGHQARLHPLLVIFAVLGGLQVFGFLGFLFGPVVVAMFVALLDIYRTDLHQS